jgi:microcystin degradation protein MlrC
MKLFIAGLATETNTFSPMPTGLADYIQVRGVNEDEPNSFEAPLAVWKRLSREKGFEIVESLCAYAPPAGITARKVYEAFRDEILADLKQALPVDAVLLNLHGAMVAYGYDDCEGDMLSRVRELVGDQIPVGTELDPHNHLTPTMVNSATFLVMYKEFPHTDFADRAKDLFRIIVETAQGKINPTMGMFDLKMINSYFTTLPPMKEFVDKIKGMEGKEGVLSISVVHCFPYADVPELGSKMLVITDGQPDKAGVLAKELGIELIKLRGKTTPPFLPVQEALEKALAAPEGPIVLSDGSDNPGGGAPGDSTFVLKTLLDKGIESAGLACLWDPIVVQMALAAGDGAKLNVRLGGKMGAISGDPLDLEFTVIRARQNVEQRFSGAKGTIGDAASLRVGGIDIIVASKRNQVRSPDVFTELGVDPLSKKILVLKSRNHFRAEFEKIAKEILYLASEGALSPDINTIPYTRIRRPKWPLDADAHAEFGL